ncbi:recombinase family protein, partial [Butyricicoccus sp. 1XD8-22]
HFLKNDVAFVSVSETLDTTTPFGMAMIGILAVFAELERATITERMQGGIRKRIEAGYRLLGGNYMPTGYKKGVDEEGNSILLIDELEAEKVRRIYDLYEQTHSISKIQKVLKDEGFSGRRFTTIKQILRNNLYIGKVKYKDEVFEGIHEPIITEEQFNRVQALMDRHPKGKNAGKIKESLFSGFITCGCCGENYTTYSYRVENRKKGNYYVRSYICAARRYPHEYDEKCENKIWKNEFLEKLYINELRMIINNKELNNTKQKKKKNYSLAFKRLDEKVTRLIDLYTDGEIDKSLLDEKLIKLNKEKENLIEEQNKETQTIEDLMTIEELNESIIDFSKLDYVAKRAVIEKTLDRIIIND